MDEWIDAFDLPLSDHLKKSQPMGLFNGSWSWRDVGERIAYRYFCWRQEHPFIALYHGSSCISSLVLLKAQSSLCPLIFIFPLHQNDECCARQCLEQ